MTFNSTATLEIEIGGLTQGTQYDCLHVVGGDVTFDPGSILKLTQWAGFTPALNDAFDTITWDTGHNLTGFANITFQPWDTGISVYVNGASLTAIYGEVPFPEPATIFTILGGLAMAGYRRLFKRDRRASGVKRVA